MDRPQHARPAALAALALALALPLGAGARAGDPPAAHWPQFHGPGGGGVAEKPVPTTWNVKTGENVLWKARIPGLGHSGPAVWGDRVYVTTAISGKDDPELKVGLYGDIEPVEDDTVHRFLVLALDRKTGEVVWQDTAFEGVPKVKRHTKASHANSSPATDGKHVVAFFGSEGLHAYTRDGKKLWSKDFGVLDSGFFRVPEAQWGFASSPVIEDGRVLIQVDVQGDSFVAALDVKTGEEIWRTAREEVPTWSTPTVVEHGGRKQVVVNGWKHIGGYDFATGKELWRMEGGGDIPVPTPVFAGGLIYITNAHGPGSPIYAIKPDAKGDVSLAEDAETNEAIVWSKARGGAYMQTPVRIGDLLFVCRDNGILSVYDAKTGERFEQRRLGGGGSGFTASGIAAGGRLYFASEVGDVYVVEADRALTPVAENSVDEIVMATPAAADGVLYVRARDHLFAIGAK